MTNPQFDEASSPEAAPSSLQEQELSRRRLRRFPRFGLRSLFVFALLFCLIFGWIGRGLYRVRQEDAAIEMLMKAGARIYPEADAAARPEIVFRMPLYEVWSDDEPPLESPSGLARLSETFRRSVGWTRRSSIASVELDRRDPNDPQVDAALAALSRLPEIRGVGLKGSAFDDDAVTALGRLPRLEALALHATRITGDGLRGLPAPERITSLSLHDVPPESNVFASLKRFPELRSLEALVATTREEVATIAALPKLERLILALDAKPGDLAPLARAKGLKRLWVSHQYDEMQEEEILAIVNLPDLESLTVHGMAEDQVPLLAGAPKLRSLDLGYDASIETAREFCALRPGCEVTVWAGDGYTFRDGKVIGGHFGGLLLP